MTGMFYEPRSIPYQPPLSNLLGTFVYVWLDALIRKALCKYYAPACEDFDISREPEA